MVQRANLKEVRAVLLDMDGVVYVGEEPLPGVQELLDYLEATARNWLFVTNNSSRTPVQFVEKIARMGIGADEAHISAVLWRQPVGWRSSIPMACAPS